MTRCTRTRRDDDIDLGLHKFRRESGRTIWISVGGSPFDCDVFALDITKVAQSLPKRLDARRHGGKGDDSQESYVPVADLFRTNGRYAYDHGVNWRALTALVLAVIPVLPGFVRAATTPGGRVEMPTVFDSLYTYAWFVTFALSFVLYLALMRGARSR